MAKIVSK